MKYIITSCFLFFASLIYGQLPLTSSVTRYDLIKSLSPVSVDVFSAGSLHAVLAGLEKPAFGFMAHQPVNFRGTGSFMLITALPSGSGSFGLIIDHKQFGGWQETQAGISYARKLGEEFQLGLKINGYRLSINGYGAAFALPVEISAHWKFTDQLSSGIHIYNVTGGKLIRNRDYIIPRILAIGFGYTLSGDASISFAVAKEDYHEMVFQSLIAYRLSSQVLVRAGFTLPAGAGMLAARMKVRKFDLDISFQYQSFSGFNAGMGFQSVQFIKEDQ